MAYHAAGRRRGRVCSQPGLSSSLLELGGGWTAPGEQVGNLTACTYVCICGGDLDGRWSRRLLVVTGGRYPRTEIVVADVEPRTGHRAPLQLLRTARPGRLFSYFFPPRVRQIVERFYPSGHLRRSNAEVQYDWRGNRQKTLSPRNSCLQW